MKTMRPCLRCGRDNSLDAETCSACSAPLQVWASEAERRPVRAAGLSPGARRILLGLACIVLFLAAGWYMSRTDEGGSESLGPSWRRPETVAAWAGERFARRDAPAERVLALVERRTSRPRRLLLTAHAPELPVEHLVRAAAEVLLAARDEGERLLIHAALLEHGPEGDRRTMLLPASDAARVLTDEAALRSLLDSARSGHLPALAELGSAPAVQPSGVAPSSGPEPGSVDDEPVAEGASPGEGAPETAEQPEDSVPAERPPSEEGVHVGLGSEPSSPITPAVSRSASATPAGPKATPPVAAAGSSSGRKPLPVSLLKGPGKRLAHSYEAGQQQVVLLRAMLHPRSKRPLILRSLTVEPHGALNDVEGIDFVYLIHDRDKNGRRDPKDEQIGDVVAFVDDDAPAVFEDLDFSFGADGGLAYLLLVVDFMDRNEGGSVMLTIPAKDGLFIEEVSTGARVRVDGAPLKGTMTTLNGDLEPDPFQEELDRLAAEE